MHPILANRYEIIGQVTRSRYSVIMLAIDNMMEDEERVAIKKFVLPLPTEESARTFEVELSMARSLKNKYLVPYNSIFSDKQWAGYFAVMPYYKSRSLREQIVYRKTIRRPFQEASVWLFLASMVDLFTYLYGSSVSVKDPLYLYNRAIHPDSIFVSQYGIFQLHRFHFGKYERFKTNKPMLTPCYHAPEVIGNRDWSIKSDVWSIACIAYEMCTLRPLYELLNADELFKLVRDTRPTFNLKGYSPDIQNLLKTMLDPIASSRASPEYLLKHPTIQHYKEMLVCAGNGVCSCGGDGRKCCDLQMEYLYSTFIHNNYPDAMEALSYGSLDYMDGQTRSCLTNKGYSDRYVDSRPVEPVSSSRSQLAVPSMNKDAKTHIRKDYSITDFSFPHQYTDDSKQYDIHYQHKDVRDFSPFDRRHQKGTTSSSDKSDKQNDLNIQSLSTKESSDNLPHTKKVSADTQGLSMSFRPHMSVDSLMYTGQKAFHYLKDPVVSGSARYESDRPQSHRRSQKSGSPTVMELSSIQNTGPNNYTKW